MKSCLLFLDVDKRGVERGRGNREDVVCEESELQRQRQLQGVLEQCELSPIRARAVEVKITHSDAKLGHPFNQISCS